MLQYENKIPFSRQWTHAKTTFINFVIKNVSKSHSLKHVYYIAFIE